MGLALFPPFQMLASIPSLRVEIFRGNPVLQDQAQIPQRCGESRIPGVAEGARHLQPQTLQIMHTLAESAGMAQQVQSENK